MSDVKPNPGLQGSALSTTQGRGCNNVKPRAWQVQNCGAAGSRGHGSVLGQITVASSKTLQLDPLKPNVL